MTSGDLAAEPLNSSSVASGAAGFVDIVLGTLAVNRANLSKASPDLQFQSVLHGGLR